MKDSIVKLLQERYFLKNEKTWEDIAKRLKWIYPDIYEYLLDFRFMFSSPAIMNANTKGERIGTLSSCFTMNVEDSIDGIGDAISECMKVTKFGGGVGYDFSSLRSSNEGVNGLGGKLSSGPLPFINIFNEVLDGVQQGGCLVKDTYIQTRNGLYIFDELIDANKENGWHEHNIDCQTKENKIYNSSKFYVNGLDNVITLKTKEGIEITGTHNHKLYIFNNNGFEYKEIQNINEDDYLCVKLGNHIGRNNIELKQIDKNDYHFNCKMPEFPINLTEEFSFFIGLLIGDGFIASNENDYRVGITIADDSYLVNTLKDLMLKLFPNSNVLFMKKENDASQTLYFSNKAIKDFLIINGIIKESSTKSMVPKVIRESNKEIIGSFLKGLFEADASISHGYPELITSSKKLAKDVQQLLFGLGSPNKIYKHKKYNSFSKAPHIYGVKILSFVGLDCWKKYIGCEKGSRFEKIYKFSPDLNKEKNYKIPNFSYWLNEDVSNLNIKLRKKINRYKNNKRNFTYSAYVNLKEDIKFKNIDNIYFSQIESKVYEKELKETYDLEITEVHNYIANGIISHNSRRGAGMSMLDIDHPDIINFIEAKKDYTTNAYARFNFSVRIPDWFYEKLEKTPNAKHCVKLKSGEQKELDITIKELWDLIIERAHSSAEPGIFNSTIATEQCTLTNINDQVLSNPCLRDTVTVLTQKGLRQLKDLSIGDKIWSKEGWTTVVDKFPTGRKEVFEYHTTSGVFESTANHEVVSNGIKIPVGEAENIDTLVGQYTPRKNIYSSYVMDGLVLGDGSKHKASNNLVLLYIGENDKDYFESEVKHYILEDRTIDLGGWEIATSIHHSELPNTYDRNIPQRYFEASNDMKFSFLRGLYSANGSIASGRVTYKTTSFQMVKDIQKMLSSVGIHSYYTTNKAKNVEFKNGIYECKVSFDVNITTDVDKFLESIGFIQNYKTEKLSKIVNEKSRVKKPKENYDIIAIESIGIYDVWDITVDNDSHTFWCDGFNISNCQEYVSIPYNSCNLGSINVEKFVEDKKFQWDEFYKLVKIATIALDNVIDKNKFPIKNIEKVTKASRPIGLGVMGLAHALYKMEIPFNSSKANDFIKKLFRKLTLVSMEQSVELAKEHGAYEYFDYKTFMNANKRFEKYMSDELKEGLKKYGCRNSSQTSIAPTGSIGFIADTSSGIEPVFALTYARKIEKLNKEYEIVYINDPVFDEYINNNYDEKTIEKILKNVAENNGSCQKCKYLTDKEKSIFVVAGDLTPMEHLESLEQVSRNISLSVSKTINLPKDISKEEISNVYLEAYKKGIIGVTVYRDGSREGILIHNTKDSIIERNAPKRPKELPCHIYRITVKGEKWIVFIGMFEGHPYEVFAGKVRDLDIGNSIQSGIMERYKSGQYKFKKEDGTVIVDNVITLFASDEQEALTRQISTNLRHGTPIDFVIEQLRKSNGTIVDFNKAILKALGKYQKNKDGGICENCGSKMIYFDGCISCMNPECSNSKCG